MGYARGILLAPIVLGILAPLFLKFQMYVASENTYHMLSTICHQSSSRSFWIAGAPMGREGKVALAVDRTQTVDGQEVFLQGSMEKKGEEALVTSVVVSTLICPLALLMKGGEGEIPAGAELRTFVSNEVKVKVPVEKKR